MGRWVDVKVNIAEQLQRELQRLRRRVQVLPRPRQAGVQTPPLLPLSECQSSDSQDGQGSQGGQGGGRPGDLPPSPPRRPVEIMLSSVTDAYQPVERTYQLTRACLQVLADEVREAATPADHVHGMLAPVDQAHGMPALVDQVHGASTDEGHGLWFRASILTKSDLILRDVDLLQRLPGVEIGLTITTTNDAVSHRYEPGAPPATRRLAALRHLSNLGFRTWAFISPVLPYHSDSQQALQEILTAIRDAGATRAMMDRFSPYPASVHRFLAVASPQAAKALRSYVADPEPYLARLRENVAVAASALNLPVRVLF